MALTPEQEAVLIAIGNAFVAAGFTTELQATQALTHLKLQNELNTLQGEYNNLADDQSESNNTFNTQLEALQADIIAKQEEIKAYIEGLG